MSDEIKPNISVALNQISNKIKPIDLPEIKPLETQSVPKRQSLKEWAMAGGGVPAQYKGREHVWHKHVQKYAAGGEVFNTVPDMSDGGQINEGPAFARGGDVHMEDGGAAFGVFPQMKPKRSKQDPEAAKNVPLDFLRGRIAGTLGMPGDIESLIRMLPGLDERTYLPTSEDIEQRLPFRSDAPVSRAAAGLGSLTANPFDVVKAGKVAGKAAQSAKPVVGKALEDYMFNQGLAMPVVKPKGGNWRGNLGIVRDQLIRGQDAAIQNWVDSNLTNYVKKQMATPDDPVRKLADEGISHLPESFLTDRQFAPTHVRRERSEAGFPEAGMATTPMGKGWESIADQSIFGRKVKEQTNLSRSKNPWMDKLDPEENIFEFGLEDRGGFGHIIDVLSQDLAAGRIRPEQLNKVSMEQAVRRTAEYDQEMAKRMAESKIRATEGMPVYKDYGDEGYQWIELAAPDSNKFEESIRHLESNPKEWQKAVEEFRENRQKNLESALKYEGDTMGHCVGGYCPDVLEGRSRIFSLRDARGEPHVTVEVQPGQDKTGLMTAEELPPEVLDSMKSRNVYDPKFMYRYDEQMGRYLPEMGPFEPSIVQIKGKQNAAPKKEYLPFVQDFVRGGQWSYVGDLPNTGLIKNNGKYMTQGEYDDYLLNQLQPPPVEGMKVGGVVKGIGALKQSIMGGGAEAAKAERVAALRQSGLSAAEAKARVELAEQAAEMKQAIRASEALAKIEGKHLNITQADRTKVGNGYLGGPGFSGLQMKEGPHKDVGAVWGVKNTGTAKTMLGGFNKPLGNEYFTTMIGSPTQHQSNQMVFDKLYKDFTAQAKKGGLDSALRQKINDRLASAVDKDGNPIFPPDIDILSNNFKKQATTFDQRALAGNVLGGVGVGGKKGQIIDYEKIIRETTDPFLLDTPSGDLGYRIWTPSGEVIERPDLHPAFPAIATGEDLGVEFKPADKNILLAPFLEKFRLEKGREPGYMDMTRGRPVRVQVTEPILRNLEESGNKKGGAIGALSRANRG